MPPPSARTIEDPDLGGMERCALKFNNGAFEGDSALALTAALSFGRSIFVPGDSLTFEDCGPAN
jgi:hypothetical protein